MRVFPHSISLSEGLPTTHTPEPPTSPQCRNDANPTSPQGESFNVQRIKVMFLQAAANVAKNEMNTDAMLVPC